MQYFSVHSPFFMSCSKRSKTFLCTQWAYIYSYVVYKCVTIHVSKHISFAKKILPSDSMIIAQWCLWLPTIKGRSKTCIFITQHNATNVASFEGACNWHADMSNRAAACEVNFNFNSISLLTCRF